MGLYRARVAEGPAQQLVAALLIIMGICSRTNCWGTCCVAHFPHQPAYLAGLFIVAARAAPVELYAGARKRRQMAHPPRARRRQWRFRLPGAPGNCRPRGRGFFPLGHGGAVRRKSDPGISWECSGQTTHPHLLCVEGRRSWYRRNMYEGTACCCWAARRLPLPTSRR